MHETINLQGGTVQKDYCPDLTRQRRKVGTVPRSITPIFYTSLDYTVSCAGYSRIHLHPHDTLNFRKNHTDQHILLTQVPIDRGMRRSRRNSGRKRATSPRIGGISDSEHRKRHERQCARLQSGHYCTYCTLTTGLSVKSVLRESRYCFQKNKKIKKINDESEIQRVQDDMSKARSVCRDWEFVSKGTEISKFIY